MITPVKTQIDCARLPARLLRISCRYRRTSCFPSPVARYIVLEISTSHSLNEISHSIYAVTSHVRSRGGTPVPYLEHSHGQPVRTLALPHNPQQSLRE